MKFSKKQWWIISIALTVVLLIILFFSGLIPGLVREVPEPVEMKFLGVDDVRVWRPIIEEYQERYTHIKIEYQQINRTDYEQALLNRLAANGPDIFMFHNTWLPKHYDKIAPANADQISADKFESLFPTVAIQNFAPDGLVFALPLYIDTLALYYNKDLFDESGIATPPKTWLQFQSIASKLPWPAAAIGGSTASVSQAPDLLNLLFLQSGTAMVDRYFGRATFGSQGRSAFNFYLSFSNPQNEFYTWNDQQSLDVDLFAAGKLPMLFHYGSTNNWIRRANPILNFGITTAPQPSSLQGRLAYANYFGLAVSNKTPHNKAAWNFIRFATTNQETSRSYLSITNRSPALRSLIQEMISVRPADPFANQALIARSWPQIDSQAIKQIFDRAIRSSLSKQATPEKALSQAEQEITNLMRKR